MKKCSVDECENPSRCRTFCSKHWNRWRRHGSTESLRPEMEMTAAQRFWSKVQKTEDCWIWTGAKMPSGHGVFRGEEKNYTAYRWAWEEKYGPVPDGLVLDHIVCDNPPCVNPDHLKVSTIGANVLRGNSPAAHHARKTHCVHGHPFEGENLSVIVFNGKPRRVCRTCARNRARAASYAKRMARQP